MTSIIQFQNWAKETVKTDIQKATDAQMHRAVLDIQTQILTHKDKALLTYTEKFDGYQGTAKTLKVTPEEIALAYTKVSKKLLKALKLAKKNIAKFHSYQKPKSWLKTQKDNVQIGMSYSAIDRVGLYVPGGRAAYPSSVLMNAIPAAIAGVPEIVITTPPKADGHIDPAILVAADLCGVKEIIKAGGAQAVFALAYGTESITKVDKIVGPGNRYVTLAKQLVYGSVDIDKPAGPSEVLVYCDQVAYADYAAAELLAQLEHDPEASAVGVSQDRAVLEAIATAFLNQRATLKRQEILLKSSQNMTLIQTQSKEETYRAINKIASEHVVIISDHAKDFIENIRHAGALFLGPYTPVTLGDYIAGPNHVLPTEKGARFASPLSVMDFMKFTSILSYSKTALKSVQPALKTLTDAEGFDGHMNAVDVRLRH